MKYLSLIAVIAVSMLFISWSRIERIGSQPINLLIGDVSYRAKFGKQPGKRTNEDLRIRTHLAYVESKLRQKDVSNMSKALRSKRKHMLDLLHQYWTAGIFPRNYDHTEKRVPCFMDKDGRICAVGYLVEQTVGRSAAEDINSRHKYDELLAMNDKVVDSWVASSGLTKEECAMIQPTYGPFRGVPSGYLFLSGLVTGANVALSGVNIVNNSRPAPSTRTIGIISMATGAASLALGTSAAIGRNDFSVTRYEGLVLFNMGIGTATMILGARNIFTKTPVKEKAVSWNLHTQPTLTGQTALGLSFTRKL